MRPDDPVYESFRHVVETARLKPGHPVTAELAMSEPDRARLAEAWGVPAIASLAGEVLAARRAGLVEVEGRVRAELTRECVASLEEMSETVEETFLALFTDDPGAAREGEVEADLDAPEPVEDGRLALDPHPRKEGAEAPSDPRADEKVTPFAALAQLKERSG